MRTMITLSTLGLTLALGLSSAALAAPSALSRDSAAAQQQTQYLHKKYYRHDQNRARGEGSGTARVPSRDGIGTASPDVRKPVVGG
jgi:hypothetical protein